MSSIFDFYHFIFRWAKVLQFWFKSHNCWTLNETVSWDGFLAYSLFLAHSSHTIGRKKIGTLTGILMDRRLTICIHLGVQTWESPLPFLWQPPPPSLNTVLLDSERMGPISSIASTVGCFPPAVPRAGYAPSTLLLFDTQRRSYTSVVVWNLFCDWNSDRQVSCCRNLRRFKQNNNHDINTTH
jgi:hypothetical protein